ncbi:flavodoxin family protein [candidate division KSB1 bacterium]|nr:flavodoxin family protein [candidate division KSB1 bacterium]NIX71471.1 flavodoxin family protein [candidate division KSB1 bacterium]
MTLSLIFLGLFATNGVSQDRPNVLVVYYSKQGHTKTMAETVADGARSVENVQVKLLSVADADSADVLAADAIILGSPVYNANVAPPVLEFLKTWPFEGAPLRNKIGAAFVTAGGMSAGEELTQMNILHAMLIFGMIVVGGPDWTQAFGASGMTVEPPFDRQPEPGFVEAYFLKKGEALGRRVAELTVRLRSGEE